jgi:hypothetical protein
MLINDSFTIPKPVVSGAYTSATNSKLALLQDPANQTALDQLTTDYQNRQSVRGSCEMPKLYLRRRQAVSKSKFSTNFMKREGPQKRSYPENFYGQIND